MQKPIYTPKGELIGEVRVTVLKDGDMVQCLKPTNVVGKDGYLVDENFGRVTLENVLLLINYWNKINITPNKVINIHYIYTLHRPTIYKGYGEELNTSHLHK